MPFSAFGIDGINHSCVGLLATKLRGAESSFGRCQRFWNVFTILGPVARESQYRLFRNATRW
ncbi:hypothetical protein RMSM_05654 [Rhodopirellula maiorica SM1]|uniref:Uncharacterized protein n=1 Tax=Rhodopirellula maiorica SM1 TaxID=1265738 RepID=M5RDG8_9BACT|nr:hypothetical protein RMSM_05654 [Rhodopirellula maiorica SM1]